MGNSTSSAVAAVCLHWVCMKDALFFLPLDKDKAESDSSQRTLVPEDNESRSMVGGLIKVQKHLAETANTLQGNLTWGHMTPNTGSL